MNRMITAATMAMMAIFLASCDNKKQSDKAQSTSIEDRLADATVKIANLTVRLDAAESTISDTSDKVEELDHPYAVAIFDPMEKGFQRVDTEIGTFLVSLKNVQQYADGIKVTLSIGNIQSVTYTNIRISGKYGMRRPSYPIWSPNETKEDRASRHQEWNNARAKFRSSLKDFSVTLTEKIRPGNWNSSIIVTLPNIKSSDFGHLALSLEGSQVEMFK